MAGVIEGTKNMNEQNKLQAEIRTGTGKGPSRRLRMKGKLPAVLYAGAQKTVPITVCPRETTKILRGPLKRNAIISLSIDEDTEQRMVMVKERQIHPTRRDLIHIDFIKIDLNKPVTVFVPIRLSGKSESVVLGGKIDHVLHKMRINCLPTDIPEFVDVDITNLPFGSTHTKDIPLPKGVKLGEKPRVVVLTIKRPRGATKEEETQTAGPAATKGK
jgi:large subunit ribosomal protein L25